MWSITRGQELIRSKEPAAKKKLQTSPVMACSSGLISPSSGWKTLLTRPETQGQLRAPLGV